MGVVTRRCHCRAYLPFSQGVTLPLLGRPATTTHAACEARRANALARILSNPLMWWDVCVCVRVRVCFPMFFPS